MPTSSRNTQKQFNERILLCCLWWGLKCISLIIDGRWQWQHWLHSLCNVNTHVASKESRTIEQNRAIAQTLQESHQNNSIKLAIRVNLSPEKSVFLMLHEPSPRNQVQSQDVLYCLTNTHASNSSMNGSVFRQNASAALKGLRKLKQITENVFSLMAVMSYLASQIFQTGDQMAS